MKKYSWIVALMIALAFVFIGCGADPLPPDPNLETFTDIPLGEFNYFGGVKENQGGWATDGHNEATKKNGLKLEDFQAAKYLVLEYGDDGIKGNDFSIVWGAVCETPADLAALSLNNPGWVDKKIASQGSFEPTMAKWEGNLLKIELSKALTRYDAYTSSTITEIKLVVSCWVGNDALKKAYLQISNKPVPFVSATKVVIDEPKNAFTLSNIKLTAVITPSDATVQSVTWQIVGGTLKPLVDVSFAPVYKMDDGFSPSVKTGNVDYTLSNAIYAKRVGTVKVRAVLKGGAEKDGKKVDVVSDDLEIDIEFNPFGGLKLTGAVDATGEEDFKWPIKSYLAETVPAKWFVVVCYGGDIAEEYVDGNDNTFVNQTQWVLQTGMVEGWDWTTNQLNTGNGTSIGFGGATPGDTDGLAREFYYFVFDLSKWPCYAATVTASKAGTDGYAQFLLNNPNIADSGKPLGLLKGFVVPGSTTITKPVQGGSTVVVDFDDTTNPFGLGWGASPTAGLGYVTNKLPGGLEWGEE